MQHPLNNPPQTFTAARRVACALAFGLAASLSAQSLDWQMVNAVDHAESRFSNLAYHRLRSDSERFVNYTTSSGTWQVQNDATWTSGFVPGSFWYLHALTDQLQWLEYGNHWAEGVRSRAYATDNDTGFQVMEAFQTPLVYDAPVDAEAYRDVILDAADTFTQQRWNPTIGAYRAWPSGEDDPSEMPFELIVDNMMNLELVLWAAENGGPAEYRDYAITHADTTWEDIVREDGSTVHVVEYAGDGSIVRKRSHQGWRPESTWSRGQAWAVYGYTMLYRYTELPRMLERAEATFDYFVAATDEDVDDAVPYSDFDAPLDSRNPRDSSAAAIVASAALELYAITGEEKYWDRATRIISSLTKEPYLTAGTRYESLLAKASEKWGEPEVGAIFADFYLLEAMWRYWTWFDPDLGSWYGYPVRYDDLVRTGRWLGSISIAEAPWLYLSAISRWAYADEPESVDDGLWLYLPRPEQE